MTRSKRQSEAISNPSSDPFTVQYANIASWVQDGWIEGLSNALCTTELCVTNLSLASTGWNGLLLVSGSSGSHILQTQTDAHSLPLTG